MKKRKIIEFRMVSNICEFCNSHAMIDREHLFRGYHLIENWYIDKHGWLCNKYIWICPECQEKLKKILKLSQEIRKRKGNLVKKIKAVQRAFGLLADVEFSSRNML